MNAVDKKKLHAALALAARSIPVFPTNDKMPCWSNDELGLKKGEGGYKVATTDPDRVRFLFNNPRAVEIAVPMGEMSGLMCVDVDLYKDPTLASWIEENASWLGSTLCHTTRSGGRHYIFNHVPDVHWPATLQPGIDLKAGGNGYVCWPPTAGYDVHQDLPVAEFPLAVLSEALKAKGGTGSINRKGNGSAMTETDEVYIGRIQDASEIYPALRQLSYRLPGRQHEGRPFTIEQGIEVLTAVMMTSVAASSSHPRHSDWQDRMSKIGDLVESAFSKRGLDVAAINASLKKANPEGKSFIKERPIGPQPTAEEVTAQVAVEIAEESNEDDGYDDITVQELHAEVITPITWVIPGMIPEGGIVSVAGASNVGKTRWLAALAVGLAVGDTARMGLPQCAEPTKVLWVANEERQDDLRRRMKAVARQHGDKESLPIALHGKDKGMLRLVKMNANARNPEIDVESIKAIAKVALKRGVKLVLLDPYISLSDGVDENSSANAAVLSKAFAMLSLASGGAAILHAHHTPKERGKAGDWGRGDGTSFRGSGAIFSALDCAFTLSHWRPRGNKKRGTDWDANYLTSKLSRWIVLDTAKIREGESIEPVVYELVGQAMAVGEGDPIGVCRLSSEQEADNALLDAAVESLGVLALAKAIADKMGVGDHPLAEVHRVMRGASGWPSNATTLKKDQKIALHKQFAKPVRTRSGRVRLRNDERETTHGRWTVVVELSAEEPAVEEEEGPNV